MGDCLGTSVAAGRGFNPGTPVEVCHSGVCLGLSIPSDAINTKGERQDTMHAPVVITLV